VVPGNSSSNTLPEEIPLLCARIAAIGLAATTVAACVSTGRAPPDMAGASSANLELPASDPASPARRREALIRTATAEHSPHLDPIIEGPKSVSAVNGEEATFSALLATQAGDVVKWVSTGGDETTATCRALPTEPSGLSTCELSAPATLAQDGTQFYITVTRADGEIVFQSLSAMLTVTPSVEAVVITSEPTSQTVPAGQSAVFTVQAEGSRFKTRKSGHDGYFFEYSAPQVQWFKDDIAIPGATADELVVTTTTGQAGKRSQIVAKVTNPVGTTVSEVATLFVAQASTVIGAAGGDVPGPKGSVLTVPAGAVSRDVTITLTEEEIPAGLLPPEFIPVGKVIKVNSANAAFAVCFELTLQGPQRIHPSRALVVARLVDAPGHVDAPAKRLSLARQSRALPTVARCLNPQNSGIDGSYKTPIDGDGKYLAFQVPDDSCLDIDSLR
jgi:hypothetical protein